MLQLARDVLAILAQQREPDDAALAQRRSMLLGVQRQHVLDACKQMGSFQSVWIFCALRDVATGSSKKLAWNSGNGHAAEEPVFEKVKTDPPSREGRTPGRGVLAAA